MNWRLRLEVNSKNAVGCLHRVRLRPGGTPQHAGCKAHRSGRNPGRSCRQRPALLLMARRPCCTLCCFRRVPACGISSSHQVMRGCTCQGDQYHRMQLRKTLHACMPPVYECAGSQRHTQHGCSCMPVGMQARTCPAQMETQNWGKWIRWHGRAIMRAWKACSMARDYIQRGYAHLTSLQPLQRLSDVLRWKVQSHISAHCSSYSTAA